MRVLTPAKAMDLATDLRSLGFRCETHKTLGGWYVTVHASPVTMRRDFPRNASTESERPE